MAFSVRERSELCTKVRYSDSFKHFKKSTAYQLTAKFNYGCLLSLEPLVPIQPVSPDQPRLTVIISTDCNLRCSYRRVDSCLGTLEQGSGSYQSLARGEHGFAKLGISGRGLLHGLDGSSLPSSSIGSLSYATDDAYHAGTPDFLALPIS